MIGREDEHLRLPRETAEGRGVQHTLAVALERRAVRRFVFGIFAAARFGAAACVGRQGQVFDLFEPFTRAHAVRL